MRMPGPVERFHHKPDCMSRHYKLLDLSCRCPARCFCRSLFRCTTKKSSSERFSSGSWTRRCRTEWIARLSLPTMPPAMARSKLSSGSRRCTRAGSGCCARNRTAAKVRRSGGPSRRPAAISPSFRTPISNTTPASIPSCSARCSTAAPTPYSARASWPPENAGCSTTGTRWPTGCSPPCATWLPTSTLPTWRPATRPSAPPCCRASPSGRTASDLNRRSPSNSPSARPRSTKPPSATTAAPTRKARKSA